MISSLLTVLVPLALLYFAAAEHMARKNGYVPTAAGLQWAAFFGGSSLLINLLLVKPCPKLFDPLHSLLALPAKLFHDSALLRPARSKLTAPGAKLTASLSCCDDSCRQVQCVLVKGFRHRVMGCEACCWLQAGRMGSQLTCAASISSSCHPPALLQACSGSSHALTCLLCVVCSVCCRLPGDVQHEVQKVVDGFRITLTYTLHRLVVRSR